MSSIASSIAAKTLVVSGRGLGHRRGNRTRVDQLLDVLGEHVHFEIDLVARPSGAERRHRERVRDERDLERAASQRGDRERDAVDRDRALLDAVAEELGRRLDPDPDAVALRLDRRDPADAVDMPLDVVPAERLAGAERRSRG